MTDFNSLLTGLRQNIREVDAKTARDRFNDGAILIDVRESTETADGIIPGSKLIPRGFLELRIEDQVPDRNAEIVLLCAGGTRSLLAGRSLQELGYTNIASLERSEERRVGKERGSRWGR